ncbi:MAG TPA: TIM-barrel domain-containing protein [Gaiellaceae bacterium]|nr:TIM-barrel domain-containing protein [Gaiellaceae bacterium]
MHWFVGTYERAQPIFDRHRRRFHPIERVLEWTALPDALQLVLETYGGKRVRARFTFPDPEVVRIQWAHAGEPDDHLTEMLVGPPQRLPVTVREEEGRLLVDAGGTALEIEREPYRLRFGPYATERSDGSLIEPVAEPGGWAATNGTNDHRVSVYDTFTIHPGEQFWGLGERFTGPGLRGRRVSHWIDEPGGTNTTDRSYKSVPFVVSSRGYALFFHHGEEATFDLGGTSTQSASVLVESGALDLFVILGTPKEAIRRYTDLTGRAAVPPEWTFGVWLSKCMYQSRAEVEENLRVADELGIPVDVIGVDPWWLADRPGKDYDFCDFQWNERDFGPLEEFTAMLHERGVRLCLWVNPNVVEGTPAFVEERLVSRGRVRESCFPIRAFVDFTGPGGDWWVEEMSRLHAAGVDAFKLDYGELLPAEGVFADGRTGREAHNLYALLASMTAARAGIPFHYTRSGTAGSQRYPVHWPGDAQATWNGFAGNLRGGLALAWSGFQYWSTDIGGFFRRDEWRSGIPEDDSTLLPPDPELFTRWMQAGMLMSHCRFHGMLGREPWLYGDEVVAVTKRFVELRRSLLPYLLRCAAEAEESGVPLLRPVALEYPHDRGAFHVDSEFLLGPDLLVAPVLEPRGGVDVYVPEGGWTDHFTGERFEGPRWVRQEGVPLDRLPLLVRDGADPFAA